MTKNTLGKGNPSPPSSQSLIWLSPIFSRVTTPSPHRKKKKNATKPWFLQGPLPNSRDLGIHIFHLANPASPQHKQPSAAPGADEQKPNRHGHERDRKNDGAV